MVSIKGHMSIKNKGGGGGVYAIHQSTVQSRNFFFMLKGHLEIWNLKKTFRDIDLFEISAGQSFIM